MSAIDDTLDLLHDHGFHHHILSLPPRNLTLTCLFRPIYWTLTVVEHNAYEESDMRLINHLVSPPAIPSPLHSLSPSLSSMSQPTPALPFIRDALLHTPLELHLMIPDWAHNPLHLQQLFVFSATTRGIFVLTVQSTSALIVDNAPRATPSIIAPPATTVLFANALATSRTSVWTDDVPSVMIWDILLVTAPSRRTPVRGLFSMRETLRDCDVVLEVQVFEGGIVTVRSPDLLFSIVHFTPLVTDLSLTFTLAISFLTDVYQYTIQ